MRIAVVSGFAPSLLNFRGPLLREFRKGGHVVLALAPEHAETTIALQELGVEFAPVPIQRASLNPFVDLLAVGHLAARLRAFKPDKVVSYSPKAVIWGSIAASLAGVQEIYALITGLGRAFSSMPGVNPSRWIMNRAARLLYRAALTQCSGVLFRKFRRRDSFPTASSRKWEDAHNCDRWVGR